MARRRSIGERLFVKPTRPRVRTARQAQWRWRDAGLGTKHLEGGVQPRGWNSDTDFNARKGGQRPSRQASEAPRMACRGRRKGQCHQPRGYDKRRDGNDRPHRRTLQARRRRHPTSLATDLGRRARIPRRATERPTGWPECLWESRGETSLKGGGAAVSRHRAAAERPYESRRLSARSGGRAATDRLVRASATMASCASKRYVSMRTWLRPVPPIPPARHKICAAHTSGCGLAQPISVRPTSWTEIGAKSVRLKFGRFCWPMISDPTDALIHRLLACFSVVDMLVTCPEGLSSRLIT